MPRCPHTTASDLPHLSKAGWAVQGWEGGEWVLRAWDAGRGLSGGKGQGLCWFSTESWGLREDLEAPQCGRRGSSLVVEGPSD